MRSARLGWILVALSGCQPAPAASHAALGEPCASTSQCDDGLTCYQDVPGGECSTPCGGAGCPPGSVCDGDRCQPSCMAPAPCKRSDFQCMGGYCAPTAVDAGVGDLSQDAPDAGPDLAMPACTVSCSARFGTSSDEEGTTLAFDPAGNVFIAGNYYSSGLDFGDGPLTAYGSEDLFLAKLGPDCKTIWSRGYGSPEADTPTQVAADGLGNALLTGFAGLGTDFGDGKLPITDTEAAYLAKIDPQGGAVFSKVYQVTGSDTEGVGVAVDAANEIGISGFLAGPGDIDFGGGKLHADWSSNTPYFAKLDPMGGHLWSRVFNPVNPNITVQASAVAMTRDGVVIGTTNEADPIDFGGGPIATPGAAVRLDGGNWVWSAGLPNTNGVAVDGVGNAFVVGYVQGDFDFGNGLLKAGGTTDAWLVKLDAATGKTLWSRRFGKVGDTWAESVAVAPDGSVAILCLLSDGATADFGGGPLTSAGLGDVALARFDPSGNPLWSARYGDADDQNPVAIAYSPLGQLGIVGFFKGTIDFGSGPLVATPGMNTVDAFVALLCL